LEEQAEIVRRIESAFGWLDRMAVDHASAARLLPQLDASILARAFRGELVPQDPDDEPAAKLLERIKAEREAVGRKPKSGRGRKRDGSKAQGMIEKPLPPRDRLLKDSEKWPAVGLPFEAIAMRNAMPHDTLRDALFDLLSGPSPALQQRFDTDAEVMVIQRVPA
jgi:type I restriction enzyme S subunit